MPDFTLDNSTIYIRSGSLILSVRDTGAGLSKENQTQLFQEGMQFNANQLQAGQGSGLGLWISKEVVQLHHGSLTATSEGENCGCVFIMELPFVMMDESVTNISLNTKEDEAIRNTCLISPVNALTFIRNILVVDDSSLNRKMVCRLLRIAGYTCLEANDGQDCVDYIARSVAGMQDPIHLILMDYEMPRMNGPTATSVLHNLGYSIPIIGITGNVLHADKQTFLDHGAIKVLNKPLTLCQLETTMAEVELEIYASVKSVYKEAEDELGSADKQLLIMDV